MRTTRMGTTVRPTPTAQQRAEAVSNFRLLARLGQIGIDRGGSRGAACFLGRLHATEGADRFGNVGRVVQFNRSHQAFPRALGGGGVGGEAGLFGSQKSSDVSDLRCRQAKEFGQKIDLPRNHLLWRRGIERPAEPTARLRAKNSRENHR